MGQAGPKDWWMEVTNESNKIPSNNDVWVETRGKRQVEPGQSHQKNESYTEDIKHSQS